MNRGCLFPRRRGYLYFALLLVLWLRPGDASAHAVLTHSQPAAESVIAGGADRIVLEFNSRIDALRSSVFLVGPAGTVRLTTLKGAGANILVAKRDALPAGTYLLRWQVLATDGHITRGEIAFRIR